MGTFLLVLSGLIALASLLMFVAFFKVLISPRLGQESSSHGITALGNFVIAAGLWFAGQWFRKRGRRPDE